MSNSINLKKVSLELTRLCHIVQTTMPLVINLIDRLDALGNGRGQIGAPHQVRRPRKARIPKKAPTLQIGNQLKTYRSKKHLGPAALARQLGIKLSELYRLEHDEPLTLPESKMGKIRQLLAG